MRQNPRFLSNKAPFHCTACIQNEIINFNRTKQNLFSERENASNQAGQSWRSVLVNVVIVQPGNLVPHKFLFSLCFSIFILFYYYFAFLFSCIRDRQRKRYVERLLRAPYNLYQISLHLRVTTCEIVPYSKGVHFPKLLFLAQYARSPIINITCTRSEPSTSFTG